MPSAIKKRSIPTAIKKTANLVRQPAHRATRVRLSLPLMRGHSPGERSNNGVGSGEQVNSGTKNGESGEHHNRAGAAGAKIWTSATLLLRRSAVMQQWHDIRGVSKQIPLPSMSSSFGGNRIPD